MDLAHVVTERLDLRAASLDDLREVHAVNADPRLWTHWPEGVSTDEQRTVDDLTQYVQEWARDGLGYWAVRRRADGGFVGIGGVRLRPGGLWNLYYRVAAEHHGHGYATEIARAAIAAAAEVRPEAPVVAYLLDHNAASRRTAERCGLSEVWRGPDRLVTGGTRVVMADRPLAAEQLLAAT